jgi:hypothetical protein
MLTSSFLTSLALSGLTLTTTLMLSPSISSSPERMEPLADFPPDAALPGLKAYQDNLIQRQGNRNVKHLN